jgi:hypothetical protein
MKRLFTIAAVSLLAINLQAQDLPMPSPESETEQMIGLAEVEVSYSRPSMKGRTIFGDLVPYDEMWRTGANKCTTLETGEDIIVNGKNLAAGTYSIFTIPGKEMWTIVFNNNTELWGTGGYNAEEDALRVEVKPSMMSDKVETFTIDFSDVTTSSAHLNIYWESTKVSVKIEHDYMDKALANIEASLQEAQGAFRTFESAAEFYIDNEMEADKALELARRSVEMNEVFWNVYTLSRAYANKGMYDEAIKAAERSLELSEAANYAPYIKRNKENIAKWQEMK